MTNTDIFTNKELQANLILVNKQWLMSIIQFTSPQKEREARRSKGARSAPSLASFFLKNLRREEETL